MYTYLEILLMYVYEFMLRDIYLPLENVPILLYTGHLVCFINKRVSRSRHD